MNKIILSNLDDYKKYIYELDELQLDIEFNVCYNLYSKLSFFMKQLFIILIQGIVWKLMMHYIIMKLMT